MAEKIHIQDGGRVKTRKYISVITLILTISVYSCATTAFTVEEDEKYVHRYSGGEFPKNIGLFRRAMIRKYDKTGYDISVGYHLDKPVQVVATIYIYPATTSGGLVDLVRELDNVKSAIINEHPGAIWIEDTDVECKSGFNILKGKSAGFTFKDSRMFNGQQVLSFTYLFKQDIWFLKYRITYPQGLHDSVDEEVNRFINSLNWKHMDEIL
jgi:hypothetical protein